MLIAGPSPLEDVSVILDLGGVTGSTGRRRESTLGTTSQGGPIDVNDSAFRSDHWDKWITIRETDLECGVCGHTLDASVSRVCEIAQSLTAGPPRYHALPSRRMPNHGSFTVYRSDVHGTGRPVTQGRAMPKM